ncbi:phosphohydrolase [Thermus filiformis]|uniref:Phosphohydrolase n=1 Tax=Thermus filiformis TaxID=276 RepID=A0A0A2WMC3_THEFI|nr:phosphohydrolase [Thermus filiformis]
MRQEVGRAQERERSLVLSQAWELFRGVETPQALLRLVVEVTQRHLQASTVLLGLYRKEEDVLEVVAGAGRRAGLALGRRLKRGEGISWRVLETDGPVYVPNVLLEPQAVFFSGAPEPAAYLGVPLKDGEGRTIGVLSADTAGAGGEIPPEDRAWLQTMAQVAGAHLARLMALEEARRQAENYKALLELSAGLEALQDPLAMAERALAVLLRLTPYEAGALYRLEGEEIRPVVLSGAYPPDFPRLYDLYPVRLGEGVLGESLALGRPLYVEDYARFPRGLPPYAQSGLKSAMLMPLRPRGALWGVLAVGSFRAVIPYRKEDEALLFSVAGRMEKALERALYQEELRQTRDAVLEALGRVLEYRDLETRGHTDRVVALTLRLGEALGFKDLEALRLGAFLHDLGKLAIPDSILLKPAPLSTGEWRVVKTHPELGYEMLKELGFLPEAALNVVLYHHERYDGTGYPFGLKGEEIPLEARIFAVADVWDALLSERPYKRAWTEEEALNELRAQAGRSLDPEVVGKFLEMKR